MHIVIGLVVGFIVGTLGGYFVGYDHGFEGAAVQYGSPAETLSGAQVMADLIGMWRSTQDEKFTREFRTDGVVIDRYEGSSPDSEGLWMVFTKDIPDSAYTGTYEDGAVYLSMAMSESERLYFKVVRVDARTLELVFLDGGTLSFTRVK